MGVLIPGQQAHRRSLRIAVFRGSQDQGLDNPIPLGPETLLLRGVATPVLGDAWQPSERLEAAESILPRRYRAQP